jgi:hypothetical protein
MILRCSLSPQFPQYYARGRRARSDPAASRRAGPDCRDSGTGAAGVAGAGAPPDRSSPGIPDRRLPCLRPEISGAGAPAEPALPQLRFVSAGGERPRHPPAGT